MFKLFGRSSEKECTEIFCEVLAKFTSVSDYNLEFLYWINLPHPYLEGETPYDLISNGMGKIVRDLPTEHILDSFNHPRAQDVLREIQAKLNSTGNRSAQAW